MRVDRHRSEASPPPADDPGVPRLIDLLRSEIAEQGPITFARFMQRGLYEPDLGYYATSASRTGRDGDFLTAVELHPIFGQSIARQLDEMWHRLGGPGEFTLREYGAGSGALFMAIRDGLMAIKSGLASALRYHPIDLPEQQALIRGRLAEAGVEDQLQVAGDGRIVGCVIANEFVDALPVHRVVWRDGRLHELYVDWGDRFVEVEGPLSDSRLSDWFKDSGIEFVEGQRAEVNLQMAEWLSDVARDLERGYVLVIDYGGPSAELYAPTRASGTLRAFRGQHVSSDVLSGVGRQDLTAHVDLDALERAAQAAGLQVLGRTSQQRFLIGCGLEELYAETRAAADEEWEAATLLRSSLRRLLDPQQMGGYAVVVLGSGVPAEPPLRGLSFDRHD